jgi:hypothetical protein
LSLDSSTAKSKKLSKTTSSNVPLAAFAETFESQKFWDSSEQPKWTAVKSLQAFPPLPRRALCPTRTLGAPLLFSLLQRASYRFFDMNLPQFRLDAGIFQPRGATPCRGLAVRILWRSA